MPASICDSDSDNSRKTAAAPVTRHHNGASFCSFLNNNVKEPVFAPFSRNASVEDGKIGLPDASVFITLMPGIPTQLEHY